MLALHGFWSLRGGLCLWAEDSALSIKSGSRAARLARPHPFAASAGTLAASSTNWWSSRGTRHSNDTDMLILSVNNSRSSGSCVRLSTCNRRLRKSLPLARAKASSTASLPRFTSPQSATTASGANICI